MLKVASKARLTVPLEVVLDPRTPERVEVEGVNTSDAVYDCRCLGFPLATSSGNKYFFSLRIFFLC